jgi:hypothetical protein
MGAALRRPRNFFSPVGQVSACLARTAPRLEGDGANYAQGAFVPGSVLATAWVAWLGAAIL